MTTAIQHLNDAQLCEVSGGVSRVVFQDCFATLIETDGGNMMGIPGTCFGTPRMRVGTPVVVQPPKQPKTPKTPKK